MFAFRNDRVTPIRSAMLILAIFVAADGLTNADDDQPSLVDVFVSGKEGYHTYRIPALLVTQKGTLFAFCEGRKTGRGDHGDLDLVLKRSNDAGKTWTGLELIYEEGGDKKITIGNPCPVVDQDTGTIWLPFCRDNDDVFITSSVDDGETWATPKLITRNVKHPDWGWYATGPGNGIQLTRGKHKGRLVIPCDHRIKGHPKRGESGRSHIIYSDDHGKTWELGGSTDWYMNECAVVELVDGSLMINMRSYRGNGCRAVAISRDGGMTWSDCQDHPMLIEPVCQGSFIRYTSSHVHGKNRLLFSNPASTKRRVRMTVRLSYDEGTSWPMSRVLYEGSAAYSSLAALPDNDVGILFERENYSQISFARFSAAWATKGDDRSIEKTTPARR